VAAWRQWTLSLPFRLRWAAVKKPSLLRQVERRLVRAVWAWQRKTARRLGAQAKLFGGAVAFVQYFGSALQLTPHLHVLVPEAQWDSGGLRTALPGPSPRDVLAILQRVLRRLARDFESLAEPWPEDGLDLLRLRAVQQRLDFDERPDPRRAQRRLAVQDGFSLHADTWVNENDRHGLERLCRYGARPPLAQERLSLHDDGRYAYRTRQGKVLLFTAEQLVRRLVALLPPRGVHLTRFHGVFAPNARLRPLVTRPPEPPAPSPAPAELPLDAASPPAPRRPRLDWASLQRRTFSTDVWACPCGGTRSVLALVTDRHTAKEVLENLRLWPGPLPLPTSQAPPQLALAL
jgi:hypothetical protein